MRTKILIILLLTFGFLYSFEYTNGDHQGLIMPTAYTMEKGQGYLTSFDLIVLNYSYALTSRTHISATTIFPFRVALLDFFMFGLKQNYFKTDKIQAAIWSGYNTHSSTTIAGNTVSFNSKAHRLHLGYGRSFDEIDNNPYFDALMICGEQLLSKEARFIVELSTSYPFVEEESNSLFSFGVRFIGDNINWELAAMRPIKEDGSNLLFLPLIKASYYFK